MCDSGVSRTLRHHTVTMTADEKMTFHFAECESEAQALVKKYRADGFHATAWAL